MPSPVLAETFDELGVAAPLLGMTSCLASSFLTRSGLAFGLSILLTATTMGTRRPWRAHRLDGLRHHAVVGRHHQDDDVGGLGAAGTHGGERRVAGGVQEGDRRRSVSTW
jgi:hypothetical protein